MQTAVLFLVFNRPDTTAKVFSAIRKAKPPRLYVAADGPRKGMWGDEELVAKVREIATDVDWPCEIKTLFRAENLGCKYAVIEALDWFFSHEARGIILEDDCLPHSDFFQFCEHFLREFENESSVMHINGNNFAADTKLYDDAGIAFTSLAQVWGWATWADRWNSAEKNCFYLALKSAGLWSKWRLSAWAKFVKFLHLRQLLGGLDSWDYVWQINVLNAGGLTVTPSRNLISNIGDGDFATHTKKIDATRFGLPVQPVESYRHHGLSINPIITSWYEKKMGLRNWGVVLIDGATLMKQVMIRAVRVLLQKMLFRNAGRIVIGSTGRAGSTLLVKAVSESLIDQIYPRIPCSLRKAMAYLALEYANRLEDIDKSNAPVIKTHAVLTREHLRKGKYIFIHADPLDSANSVLNMCIENGRIWGEEHIFHLEGKGDVNEIHEKDTLNYSAQIKSWGESDGVFTVAYLALWSRRKDLSDFLGFDVKLPKKRGRTEKLVGSVYNEELFDRLRKLRCSVFGGDL